ncbi:putative uncharacterized protein [Prevotella sp. CAG:732]|mgnify:FL=1|nr:putative uncharacterized protein [Prevotella sp. CAG:732]
MRIDDFSLAFNCPGCPSWGTAIVNQDTKKVHLIKKDVASNIVIGMMHKCVTLNTHDFSLPIGKGSRIYYGNTGFDEATSEPMLVSVFDKVFINGIQIPASFVMTIIRDKAEAHKGRLQIKYTPKLKYGAISNEDFFREAIKCLHLSEETPWVIYDIDIAGQEELHFKALIGSDVKDLEHQMRNLPQIEDVEVADHTDILSTPIEPTDETTELDSREYAYMAAIKTKPFLILGGFSGTGKSLLVKSLAFTTCPCDGVLNTSETSPGNYLLVSVKPNWHDATDITGFRSSVNRNYYVTDFMRFLVKAKLHPNVPFFVCLDEMNLAPVEEYFADFLSVIESRKRKKDGTIVTDAIVPASVFNDKDYADDFDVFLKIGLKPINEVKDITEFTAKVKESDSDESEFFEQSWLVEELKRDGLTIPQNVIIIGTVNMDDTTNSFSRKVIDRAMTFETIVGTFDSSYFDSDVTLGYVKNYRKGELFISDEVRATEMMEDGRFTLSDEEKNRIIGFINDINSDMEGTPFKISYRILNETILLYRAKQKIVELMGEEEENDGVEINTDLNSIFDDVLMQKVLPRIEGDFEKCDKCLVKLGDRAERMEWKQSSEKIEFMIKRFGKDHSGFTSFWN